MLPESARKEALSRSYIQAVAAKTGVTISTPGQDFGVDGTFKKIGKIDGRIFETGIALDYQLKATTNFEAKDGTVIYDLEAKTYKDFLNTFELSKRILILFCLPKESEDWVKITEDCMELRKCCYWWDYNDKVEEKGIDNKSSVRIKISRSQIFDHKSLKKLLDSEDYASS